ncbi:hypothetical protein [Rhodococcus sp. T7]|uniref:hypothetical protein n=1 Tax=Rhodococcus sp. T7 TaxID=627444 RepID=UPI0013C8D69F|nr:hypothetical protein [Rhodococcus sp. T7]KAF0957139.1 hypothetical protein MLGJGCBP_08969 [Rhodococcus sp. T7]KAF0958864.1 hypothetical protein MLGJGCBP_08058 [Rhodococcus sp. T7]
MRQALASAVPPPRKPYRRRVRPAIDDWAELVDSWLVADKQAPRKQRHTARRVWQRSVSEHGATMSEATVTRYVRRRSELGLAAIEVTVSQTHLRSSRICPTCGHEPTTRAEAAHQRADLAVDWLHLDPDRSGQLTSRYHCRHCEPDQPAVDIAGTICGDGPILTGPSAARMEIGSLPDSILRWLTDAGWDTASALRCPVPSST